MRQSTRRPKTDPSRPASTEFTSAFVRSVGFMTGSSLPALQPPLHAVNGANSLLAKRLRSASGSVFVSVFALSLLFVRDVNAQEPVSKGSLVNTELPRPDVEDTQEYDYKVEFAGPPQTGYMMINDRGVERGPYETYEEANDVGMNTPWVYFWVEEIEYQTWYCWDTFDTNQEAQDEADWLRDLGFWARVKEIPVWSKSSLISPESLMTIHYEN